MKNQMKKEIQLGDQVIDTLTGLKGTVIALTYWLNGCIRVSVQPRGLTEGKPHEYTTIDEPQLEILQRAQRAKPQPNGGDRPNIHRQPDPRR